MFFPTTVYEDRFFSVLISPYQFIRMLLLSYIVSPVVTLRHTVVQWFQKNVCKNLSCLTFIEMLGLNITLTKRLSKRQKIFVQTVMYNGKLNKNYLSTSVRLYENLKPKSSVLLPQIQIHFLKNYNWFVDRARYIWMLLKWDWIIVKYQYGLVEISCHHLKQIVVKLI